MGSKFVGTTLVLTFCAIILIMARLHQKPLCINSQYIEKITFSDQSHIFRCGLSRTVPYNTQFKKYEDQLHFQIVPFEQWIRTYLRVRSPRIQIYIVDTPSVTRTQGNQITIWSENLDQPTILQTEIAKILIRQHSPLSKVSDALAEFYVKVWNNQKIQKYGDESAFISHQWWRAYKAMSLQDKHRFLGQLPYMPESSFKLNESVAQFSFLLLTPNFSPHTLTQFDHLQIRHPQLSLGIWDRNFLYHVQSRSRLTEDYFRQIKAQHLIWESCDDLDLQTLIQMPAQVRKLLVVRNCDHDNNIDYSSYIERGVEGFAARYPSITFVRMDIPSLKSKKDIISTQYKIFDLMAKRQVDNPFFLAYGWQEINLNSKLQIYVPRAYVDAVESFRVR